MKTILLVFGILMNLREIFLIAQTMLIAEPWLARQEFQTASNGNQVTIGKQKLLVRAATLIQIPPIPIRCRFASQPNQD